MFIPHTKEQKKEMLKTIGVKSFDDLISALPPSLLRPSMDLPSSMSEMELVRHMEALAKRDHLAQSYLGAGAYEHFIPTSVWSLTLRGEFATAYTPYQAEASQGTLQSIYEFQTLVAQLFDMEVANASMYDGASSAAEACLVALRHTGRKKIVLLDTVHPQTRKVIETYLSRTGAEIITIKSQSGVVSPEDIKEKLDNTIAAVLVQTPNFFGCLEKTDEISKIVHEVGALLIASSYPVALGLISPPGEYDADIAVAEAQSLGLPLGYGGPYLGIFACKKSLMRKMPGRVVGQTVDKEGRRAYVLTLQAREQHIRREKATSNICTNQALCALASTVHMSLLGKEGIKQLANLNFQKAHYLASELKKKGFSLSFDQPFFNEFAIKCPISPEKVVDTLSKERVLAGLPLDQYYPELKDHLLLCVTEIKTKADIDQFIQMLEKACR